MLSFYCYKHEKVHEASDWRGKPQRTKNGVEIQHICLEYHESHYPEFVPNRIRDERVQFANDQLQSHRQGEFSKEFAEAHPNRVKQMIRDGAITKEEVKKAKYVWPEVKGVTKKIDAEALAK